MSWSPLRRNVTKTQMYLGLSGEMQLVAVSSVISCIILTSSSHSLTHWLPDLLCPAGTIPNAETPANQASCGKLPDKEINEEPATGGCSCPPGYIFDHISCVEPTQCGCTDQDGVYRKVCISLPAGKWFFLGMLKDSGRVLLIPGEWEVAVLWLFIVAFVWIWRDYPHHSESMCR